MVQKVVVKRHPSLKKDEYKGRKKSRTQIENHEFITVLKSNLKSVDRINIFRQGLKYDSIMQISQRIDAPIKTVLALMGIPQTTYNKKKEEGALLNKRDSELIVLINELVDYGIEVFNGEEEKFQRWLKKPNLSLGGSTPESLLDTFTGIEEVRFALDRIEYGNFA